MFLLFATFSILIGSCAADDNSSIVDVDLSVNSTGHVILSSENVNTTALTYTLSVNFSHVAASSALSISITTTLNDTRVTVVHPIDGEDEYTTNTTLQVYRAAPSAAVRVLLNRPNHDAFELGVAWRLFSIETNKSHTVELTAERPSYIEYQGYMGRLAYNGAVVVITPPYADLCISRPKTNNTLTSTMFVYAGGSVNSAYVGRVDKLFGCAGDRDRTLPDFFTVVAPYGVSIVDTPVFTLKAALTSYSMASFSPQLLNGGPLTVTIDKTPQTFFNSQNSSMELQTTLDDFHFSDDEAVLHVWCGSLYDRKFAKKYMIANISRSSLDKWAYGSRFNAFCRSLTLKTSKGTVGVKVGSSLLGDNASYTRLLKVGSRGTITNFNYPFPDMPSTTENRKTLRIDNQENIPFYILFSKLASQMSVINAESFNTNGKKQYISSEQAGQVQRVSAYQVKIRSDWKGLHYRMDYSVGGGSHIPTAATLFFSLAAMLLR